MYYFISTLPNATRQWSLLTHISLRLTATSLRKAERDLPNELPTKAAPRSTYVALQSLSQFNKAPHTPVQGSKH